MVNLMKIQHEAKILPSLIIYSLVKISCSTSGGTWSQAWHRVPVHQLFSAHMILFIGKKCQTSFLNCFKLPSLFFKLPLNTFPPQVLLMSDLINVISDISDACSVLFPDERSLLQLSLPWAFHMCTQTVTEVPEQSPTIVAGKCALLWLK